MTTGTISRPFPVRMACSLLLTGLLLGMPAADARKAPKRPAQDFLPPVATINGKLTPQSAQTGDDGDLGEVSFVAVAPTLNKTPRVEKLVDDISAQELNPGLKTLADLQLQVDEADLNRLWEATVERNPVIRFSLEKIATPADIQNKQSSLFLRKTLNVLISGATMAATSMPGGGAYRDMGAMAANNALQNLVNGRTQPTPNSLSATEQIQLAGLIDELKVKLIRSYQDYKNTLKALAESHEVTMKNNNLYSQALSTKNDLAIMAAGTAYYQSLNMETALRQKAKLYRLQLERLAGTEAVDDLQLALVIDADAMRAAGAAARQTSSLVPADALAVPAEASAATGATPLAMPLAMQEIGPMLPDAEIGPEPPIGPLRPVSAASPRQKSQKSQGLQPIGDKIDEGGRL